MFLMNYLGHYELGCGIIVSQSLPDTIELVTPRMNLLAVANRRCILDDKNCSFDRRIFQAHPCTITPCLLVGFSGHYDQSH